MSAESFLKERGRSRPGNVRFLAFVRASLSLDGRVEVSVGVKGSGGARPCSGHRALTATPFGACCSGTGRSKRLVLLSGWGSKVGRWRLQCRFPGAGRRWGCRSFLRRGVRHEAVHRDGRSGSINGSDLAGFGGQTLHDPQPTESGVLTPRAVSGAGPGRGDRAVRRRRARAVFGPRPPRRCCGCRGVERPFLGCRR
jgi:hypothetical protein